MKKIYFIFLLSISNIVHSKCDSVAEIIPVFGVEDRFSIKNKSYLGQADFRESCSNLTTCYSSLDKRRSSCEEHYHDELTQACGFIFTKRTQSYGKCMNKVNKAVKQLEQSSGSYYRTLQRKSKAKERSKERKIRADKRMERSKGRAEERRKLRRKSYTQ